MNTQVIGSKSVLFQPADSRRCSAESHPGQTPRIPFLVWVVLITTFVGAFLGSTRVLFFLLQGWAWVVPLTFAGFRLARYALKTRFPFQIWIPWVLWITVYYFLFQYNNALQRTLMLLCPLVVGAAVSTLRIDVSVLEAFGRRLRQAVILFFVLVLAALGVFLTGNLPEASGLAPQVMTSSLLASVFAVRFAQREKSSFFYWGLMAAVPVMALTRTGIVATAFTLPLTFGPLKLRNRLFIIGLMALGAVGLFYTERIQHKMFYSGHGTLEEVRIDNPDFRTSGRTLMWESLWAEVERNPWFGHGANAQEEFIQRYFGGGVAHPHNDWLRLLYDYGYLGTALFALSFAGFLIHFLWIVRRSHLKRHWLTLAVLSSFIPFLIFMVTDNIILYAAFFGNLQFTMIGMIYATVACNNEKYPIQIHSKRVSNI